MLDKLALEATRQLDSYSYLDPKFEWNMEGRIQAALHEGVSFLKDGKPNLALTPLQAAIDLDKKLWIAHYYKGIALRQTNRVLAGYEALLLANQYHKHDFIINLELGKTADMHKSHFAEAEKYLNAAASLDPSSWLPSYHLGNHYVLVNKKEMARSAYSASLRLNSSALDAEVKLSTMLVLEKPTGWYESSVDNFNKILQKDSLHKVALMLHGVLTAGKDNNSSLKDFDKLVRIDPDNMWFRVSRGIVMTQLERYNEAFADFMKILERKDINVSDVTDLTYTGRYVMTKIYGYSDQDAVNIRKAFCLLFIQDPGSALRSISDIATKDQDPLCLFLMGIGYQQNGNNQDACIYYEKALEYDADIFDAQKRLGISHTEKNEWEPAINNFSEMLRINPEAYVAYKLRGISKYRNDDLNGAIEDLTRFLNSDSTDSDAFGYRAMAYRRTNQILPYTYDVMKGRYFAVPPNDSIKLALDQLVVDKDTARAIFWIDKFIATKRISPYFPLMKIELLMRLNKWEQLQDACDRAMDAHQKMEMKMALGPRFNEVELSSIKSAKKLAKSKLNEHIKELNAAIRRDKNNPALYVNRAKAYLKVKNRESAVDDLNAAINLGSKDASQLLDEIR